MKSVIFASAAGVVLAVLLSSPTFAQTTPSNAAPTPAGEPPVVQSEPAADTPLDELISAAVTPEDRMRLMLRCSGPPPRPIASPAPASETPAVAERDGVRPNGG